MLYFLQHQAAEKASETRFGEIEGTIIEWVQALKLFIETIGAIIIGVGVLIALFYIVKGLIPPQVESYNKIRLVLARYLALALEFQLGADILSTAIAPSWDQIGKLGAIAVIRTALNYFLAQEMKVEKEAEDDGNNDKTLLPKIKRNKDSTLE